MANKKRLLALTRELIRIDSQNPPGNESRIAAFVGSYLKKLGLRVRLYEFAKNRPNVVAYLAGRNKGRSLLITPHLDTVPAGKSWTRAPFAAQVRGEKLYGLGATDCKGNLASALEALRSIIEDGLRLEYTLVFAATADEETGSDLGLIPLLDKGILTPDAALVLDSDDFEIIVAQKGLLHVKVKVRGKRAHGAYPWLGVNAIDEMLAILQALKRHAFEYAGNKYLKPPTVNIGTIRGGDKVNIVADWCECELDFRFTPGMSAKAILRVLERIVRSRAGKFEIEIEGSQKPYVIKEGHSLVKDLVAAMRAVNVQGRVQGSEGATTITFFQDKHIPAVATGFGCAGCAHIADEYVKIDSLYKGALVLETFLKNYTFGSYKERGG